MHASTQQAEQVRNPNFKIFLGPYFHLFPMWKAYNPLINIQPTTAPYILFF